MKTIVKIFDLKTGEWELQEFKYALVNKYEVPYISFIRNYKAVTKNKAVNDEKKFLDDLIKRLQDYRTTLNKDPQVINIKDLYEKNKNK